MRRHLLAILLLAPGSGLALAQTIAGKPHYGSFGFDLAGMDRSVAPGDEFFLYASGTWEKAEVIPADRAYYGVWDELDDKQLADTRTILEAAAARPGSGIGDFYASFTDERAADAKGATPLAPVLAAIDEAADRDALAAEHGRMERIGVSGLFRMGVGIDDKAPTNYIVQLRQGGLGMPDRDYYLRTDARSEQLRQAYIAYLGKLLSLSGRTTTTDAPMRAAAVFAFEKQLAMAHWTRIENREADKTYNKRTLAALATATPGYGWTPYLQAVGAAAQPDLLVGQPSALTGEAAVWAATPLPVLKDHAALRVLDTYAPYLSAPLVAAEFDLHMRAFNGVPENQARWKRGVSLVQAEMGEAVGREYVARFFPPEAKAAADGLVRNLIAAMGGRLRQLSWMAPETKTRALAKLASFDPMIGYPARWRDYSALVVRRDDLVGNVERANAFEHQYGLDHLGRPVDRGEWHMTPMAINAYASFKTNQVVFPAAVLQPPFFDPAADPAVNYGGIGAIIGHEISHHFDDQGRKYDATGALADWWAPADITRFKALTDRLVAQSSGYEVLPGLKLNGQQTLGENIADLAGLTVAYDAYHASLRGRPAPVIDGLTGDQRFFLGFAQVWRTKTREASLREQVSLDYHSPEHQRALMPRNLDAWYSAFGVKLEQKLYLAPKERVRIW